MITTLNVEDTKFAAREDRYLAKQDAARAKFEKELNEESFAKAILKAVKAMDARDNRVGSGLPE